MLEANEDKIESVLSERTSRVYDQLVNYLSLHDIHLLIRYVRVVIFAVLLCFTVIFLCNYPYFVFSTLECLYSLSSLGESACNSIVRTHGAVEALVSLVSVEAQSYGPKVHTFYSLSFGYKIRLRIRQITMNRFCAGIVRIFAVRWRCMLMKIFSRLLFIDVCKIYA